jgi:hypothetical protein
MAVKLLTHAISTPNLQPELPSEAVLLLSVAPAEIALKWLQTDGNKWTNDIELRPRYIHLLNQAKEYAQLRDFCEAQVEEGASEYRVLRGWITATIEIGRADPSQT